MQTETQTRLPKFKRRPEQIRLGRATDRKLDIIETIARYRLIPTSLILHLVGGNHRVTQRYLQQLFHHQLVNRFAPQALLRQRRNPGEMCYFLDNASALRAFFDQTSAPPENFLWDVVEANRKNPYTRLFEQSGLERSLGRLLFLDHDLMINRFRAHLELACRETDGEVILADWRQGPSIEHALEVPKIVKRGNSGYEEIAERKRLPLRPDALFSLNFPNAPEGQQWAHFFYEADRKRETNKKRFYAKLRVYFYCVTAGNKEARKQRLMKLFGIPRVRAVLIETLDDPWAEQLRKRAAHPSVSGSRPTPLFWVAGNKRYTEKVPVAEGSPDLKPQFLLQPKTIFHRFWKTPVDDQKAYSLLD